MADGGPNKAATASEEYAESGILHDGVSFKGNPHPSPDPQKPAYSIGFITWPNGDRFDGAYVHGSRSNLHWHDHWQYWDEDDGEPFVVAESGVMFSIPYAQDREGECGRVRDWLDPAMENDPAFVKDVFGSDMSVDDILWLDMPSASDADEMEEDPSRWPAPMDIDPATIVVIQGLKEDEERIGPLRFWWYTRIRINGMACRRLLRIPAATAKRYFEWFGERPTPRRPTTHMIKMWPPETSGGTMDRMELEAIGDCRKVPYVYPRQGKMTMGANVLDGSWFRPLGGTADSVPVLAGPVTYRGSSPCMPARYTLTARYRNGMAMHTAASPCVIELQGELHQSKWVGETRNFLPDGTGVWTFADGATYRGTMHPKPCIDDNGRVDAARGGIEGFGTYTRPDWEAKRYGDGCWQYTGTFEPVHKAHCVGHLCNDRNFAKGKLTILLHRHLKYEYVGHFDRGSRHGSGNETLWVRLAERVDWKRVCWRRCGYRLGVPDPEFNVHFVNYGAGDSLPQKGTTRDDVLKIKQLLQPTAKDLDDKKIDFHWHFGIGMLSARSTTYRGLMKGDGRTQWREGWGVLAVHHSDERSPVKECYEGQWKNNQRAGEGRMKLQLDGGDEYLYEGQWKADLYDGSGTSTAKWYDYTGEFKKGKKHGTGKIVYRPNNPLYGTRAEYSGAWAEDHFQGLGKMTYRDGSCYEGAWHKHKAHGPGKRVLKNGDVWEGTCKMGLKEDPAGKIIKANGDTLVGPWRDNKREGVFTETCAADGCVTKLRYVDDKRVKMSKKRALRNAMEELDEHQEDLGHTAYVRMSKRLKVVYEQLHDPDAPMASGDEGGGVADDESDGGAEE